MYTVAKVASLYIQVKEETKWDETDDDSRMALLRKKTKFEGSGTPAASSKSTGSYAAR